MSFDVEGALQAVVLHSLSLTDSCNASYSVPLDRHVR